MCGKDEVTMEEGGGEGCELLWINVSSGMESPRGNYQLNIIDFYVI